MPVISDNKYNKVEPNKLLDLLIREKIVVDDLEPKNRNHIQAVLNFYRQMPSKMKDISTETDYKFLYEVLRKDYRFFVNLDKKQYRQDAAQLFLDGVLKDTKNIKKGEYTPEIYLSYDEKIVISYEYVTRKGDELYYFDNELKVPASLISKFKITIRIEKPVEFVKMLDVSVRDFCSPVVFNKLYYIFNSSFRKVLLDMVTREGFGYYKVTNSIMEIEQAASKEIDSRFPESCVVTTSLVVKRIEVDREVRDKMEDEFFELRKKRINIDEELKYQKDSMELFGRKLELMNKYSAPAELLTEAEKDKAFDRYAKKGQIAAATKRSGSALVEKTDEALNGGLEIAEDKVTTQRKSIFFFIRLFSGLTYGFAMFVFTMVFMIRGNWRTGLIAYGVASLVFGAILIITAILEHKKGATVLDDVMNYDEIK